MMVNVSLNGWLLLPGLCWQHDVTGRHSLQCHTWTVQSYCLKNGRLAPVQDYPSHGN